MSDIEKISKMSKPEKVRFLKEKIDFDKTYIGIINKDPKAKGNRYLIDLPPSFNDGNQLEMDGESIKLYATERTISESIEDGTLVACDIEIQDNEGSAPPKVVPKKITKINVRELLSKEELNQEIEKLKEQKNELDSEVTGKKKQLDEIEKALTNLGVPVKTNVTRKEADYDTGIQREGIAEHVQKYLSSHPERPYYCNLNILEMFYSALCTKQLIILCGKPGTGKTSLVENFCEAVGAIHKIIPVQPNWMDNQDLLGFYNPVDRTYVSTPFLDMLIEAENDPERLYCVCLDEMNLSHVEYYFSEFLSILQTKDKEIKLYSKQLLAEIDEISQAAETNLTKSEKLTLKRQYVSLQRYKPDIKIPDNIRFIGTVNKDETTKTLSPKVVDRAFVIEIGIRTSKMEDEIKRLKSSSNGPEKGKVLRSDLFKEAENSQDDSSSKENVINSWATEISGVFEKLDIILAKRFETQVSDYWKANLWLGEDKIKEYLISCLALPKINFNPDSEDERKKAREFLDSLKVEEYCPDGSYSRKILDKIEEFYDQKNILTYWR